MKINYTLFAKIYPSIIIMCPILFTINTYINLESYFNQINNLIKLIGLNLTLGAILIFVVGQVIRLIAKKIEKHVFNDEKSFVTTLCLLPDNDIFSKEYKEKIYKKINTDFKIKINKNNTPDNIAAIVDSVRLIRTKIGNGRLVINRNSEYGFMRNLLGGLPIIIVLSIVEIIIKHNIIAIYIWVPIASLCFLLLLFSKPLLIFFSKQYAIQLFSEYAIKGK